MTDYSKNNFWGNNARLTPLYDKLSKLIPSSGACEKPRSDNKALEKVRTHGNAYYDIFNNGGCNRGEQIRRYFGFSMSHFTFGRRTRRINWERIHAIVEPIMNRIILDAAFEQNLIEIDEYRAELKFLELEKEMRPAEFESLRKLFAVQTPAALKEAA